MVLSMSRNTARLLTVILAAPTRATWRPLGHSSKRALRACPFISAVPRCEPSTARSAAGNEEAEVEWISFAGRTVARSRLEEGETLLEAARAKGVELEGTSPRDSISCLLPRLGSRKLT